MRKQLMICDHCQKEITGVFNIIEFKTGRWNGKSIDMCEKCFEYLVGWIIREYYNLPDKELEEF